MAFLEYKPTTTLFQYCSPDAFLGILRSKQLWLSDLASANDPREIRLGYEHFIEAVKSVRQNEYRGVRGQFLSKLADQLATYHKNSRAFCCCFSMAVDELPMWAAYGANYGGLAIGFRPTAVLDMPGRIQKVVYVNENTCEDFRRLVFDIAGAFDGTHDPDDLDYWIAAIVGAHSAATALKHETWQYEREVRMIHMRRIAAPEKDEDPMFSITDLLPDGKPIIWASPLERSSGTKSIKYLQFPFGRFRKGRFDPSRAIERVIVGPNCPLSPADVTEAMKEHGFEGFNVEKSICKIR
jgi:hypothetical protein